MSTDITTLIDFATAADDAHKIFTVMQWSWAKGEGPHGVPTWAQIKDKMIHLASSAYGADDDGVVSSGRLFAAWHADEGVLEVGIHTSLVLG